MKGYGKNWNLIWLILGNKWQFYLYLCYSHIQKSVYVTKLIQDCINEDSLLLLRCLTEELIKKNIRQNISGTISKFDLLKFQAILKCWKVRQMKRIINIFLRDSSHVMNKQSRKIISNYLIGVIMSLIRNTDQYENERINQLIMILESVLPYVYGITMKQLKNTLRKEKGSNWPLEVKLTF